MKNLRPEVQADLKTHKAGMHGITDLMDDMILSAFNITDDGLDFICENASDEDLDEFMAIAEAKPSFTKLKKAILIRDKYLKLMKNQES